MENVSLLRFEIKIMNISVAKTSTHDRPPVLVGLIAHFDQSAEQIGHEIRFLH